MEQLLHWAPLLSPLFAAVIVVIGWYAAYRSNMARDRANKRHDMIIQYLLEAYRRLEMAANREGKTEEQAIAFESAVADIQLLGSINQISETVKYLESHAANGSATINQVLSLLRDDLRKELGLVSAKSPLKIFRFVREVRR